MMSTFAFTCLLPVFAADDPEAFDAAVQSVVVNSVVPNLTILCQDGELPDPLEHVVSRWTGEPSIIRVRNAGRRGLQHNLNSALDRVTTPWVCRADADDINRADRFERQLDFLQRNTLVDVLGSDIEEFFPDGRTRRKAMLETHEEIVRQATYRNPINHMTAFIRTSSLMSVGGYPDVDLREDYALWVALMAAGAHFANIPEPLVKVRLGNDFYGRRSGGRHVRSELKLALSKARTPQIGHLRAALSFVLRAGVLASGTGLARMVYEKALR